MMYSPLHLYINCITFLLYHIYSLCNKPLTGEFLDELGILVPVGVSQEIGEAWIGLKVIGCAGAAVGDGLAKTADAKGFGVTVFSPLPRQPHSRTTRTM